MVRAHAFFSMLSRTDQSHPAMSRPKPYHRALPHRLNKKGFTVLELLVVVIILGVLASMAIMFLLEFKEKGYVVTLASDLTSAYDASMQYYFDHPSGTVTLDIITQYGYRQSKNVNLNVVDGSLDHLHITATHPEVKGIYQVDQDGYVSKQ
jgi:prepilin-type N-terminal cleavage/methylation domain-containing protein